MSNYPNVFVKIKLLFVNCVHAKLFAPIFPQQRTSSCKNRNREQNVKSQNFESLIMIICHFSMFPQGHMNSEASAWWGLNMHQSDTIWICLLRHFVKSDSRFWYNVIWPRPAPYWIQRRGWVAEILIFHRPLSTCFCFAFHQCICLNCKMYLSQ